MELLYCYIDKYNSIIDGEFNFGWRYQFQFNKSTKTLIADIDHNYIDNFFPANIYNVSAIVGENGAGKSSFVEFIIKYLPNGNAIYSPNSIIIHYDDNENRLIIYLGPDYLNITIQLSALNYVVVNSLRNEFDYGEIVYFTNSLYDRVIDSDMQGLLNVSLKNLLFNHDSKNFFIPSQEPNIIQVYFNFRFKEYWRILRLIQSGLDFGIDFKLPNYLVLYINEQSESLIQSNFLKENREKLFAINKYYQDLTIYYKDDIDKFLISLERTILYDWIAHYQSSNPLKNLDISPRRFEKGALLLSFLEVFSNPASIENVNQFLEKTELILKEFSARTSVANAWLDISKINQQIFKDYIDTLKTVYNWDSSFISIGFSFQSNTLDEFSSGQMAFLTMLARFYSLSEKEQRFANLKIESSVLVLVDEGELYLHPSWQRKVVSLLVKTLSKVFNNAKVQIILTSHSPFVLSDLPKSKVSFLVNNRNGLSSTSELLQHRQTLASNIHTLLADTFFMTEGFIGEYATEVINNIIKDLNSVKTISNERRDHMKKVIFTIGEPLIKQKLLEMYEVKFNLDIDDRISKIENRLGK